MTRGEVWIFLRVETGNETEVTANGSFLFEAAGRRTKINNRYRKSEGSGFKLCTTAEFFDPAENYFVDGKLILKCHVSLVVEREDDEVPWDAGSISSTYNEAGKNFEFIVDEHSIKVSFYLIVKNDLHTTSL